MPNSRTHHGQQGCTLLILDIYFTYDIAFNNKYSHLLLHVHRPAQTLICIHMFHSSMDSIHLDVNTNLGRIRRRILFNFACSDARCSMSQLHVSTDTCRESRQDKTKCVPTDHCLGNELVSGTTCAAYLLKRLYFPGMYQQVMTDWITQRWAVGQAHMS